MPMRISEAIRAIADAAIDATVIVDGALRVVHANRPFLELAGIPADQFPAKDLSAVCHRILGLESCANGNCVALRCIRTRSPLRVAEVRGTLNNLRVMVNTVPIVGEDGEVGALESYRVLPAVERRAVERRQAGRDEQILKKRAEAAAEERATAVEPEARMVAFRTAGQLFGVALEAVVAITLIRQLTPLPGVPPALAGLLNVRGRHITAIDLGLLLERSEGAKRRLGDAGKAISVSREGREVAFIAEELLGIRELFAGDAREIGGGSGAIVHQLGPEGMEIVDLERLFADGRLRPTGDH